MDAPQIGSLIEQFKKHVNAHSSHSKNWNGLQPAEVDLRVLDDNDLCITFSRQNPTRNVTFRMYLDPDALHLLFSISKSAEKNRLDKLTARIESLEAKLRERNDAIDEERRSVSKLESEVEELREEIESQRAGTDVSNNAFR